MNAVCKDVIVTACLVWFMILGLLPAPPAYAQKQIKAAQATTVEFLNAQGRKVSYLKVGDKEWNQVSANAKLACQETNRDEWSVYLSCSRSNSNRKITVVLNLFKKEITRTRPNGSVRKFPISKIGAAPDYSKANQDVTSVDYTSGGTGTNKFLKIADKTWRQGPVAAKLTWKETRRDESSIYLSRKNPNSGQEQKVTLNLQTKKILIYSRPGFAPTGFAISKINRTPSGVGPVATKTPTVATATPKPPAKPASGGGVIQAGTVYISSGNCPTGKSWGRYTKFGENGCLPKVEFHSQNSLSLGAAQSIAVKNGWVMATAEEVKNAWTQLNLDTFAYGMLNDGRFAVPVQKDHPPTFKRGANIGVTGGNQGFFYVKKEAVARNQSAPAPKPQSNALIISNAAPTNPVIISDGAPKGVLPLRVPTPGSIRSGVWNRFVQHPAQRLFRLGDAVMLRQAATLQLRSKGQASAASNVTALLEQVRQDPVARWRFVPFLLRVTFDALSARNPNPSQKEFRKTFEYYVSHVQYQTAVYTRQRWLQYTRQDNIIGPPQPYKTGTANLLPQYASVSGFNKGNDGSLGIGPQGKNAIQMVLAPAVAHNLPDYENKAFEDLGKDLDGTAAAIGLGAGGASTAVTLLLVSKAVLGYSVAVPSSAAVVAAGGPVSTLVTVTPKLLAAGGVGALNFSFVAAAGIGIALAFAAVLGAVFADVIKSQLYDKELKNAVAAGPQPFDVYSILNPRYEYQAGLWNPVCKPGYRGIATFCYKNCTSGFTDNGLYCGKPAPYTRPGYRWQPGDPPLPNYSGPRGRCEKRWGKGNCQQVAALYYPKCRTGFYNAGSDVCSPKCPQGFSDIGVSCKKPLYDRGVGSVPNPTETMRKTNRIMVFSYLMKMLVGDPADDRVLSLAYPKTGN